jgi:Class II flagellar assembly regulator
MTGIERVGWPTAPRVASRPAAKSGFFVPSEATGPGQADAVAVPAATSLGSMLALQEADIETVEDREARKHGHDMLAALAELQRALLGGGDDGVALQRLGDLAASVRHATDPRLAAMVSAIVLRVQVEMARRKR